MLKNLSPVYNILNKQDYPNHKKRNAKLFLQNKSNIMPN